jgi:hypothetical protein
LHKCVSVPSVRGVRGTVVPHLFGISDEVSRGKVFLDEGLLGFISKQARGLGNGEVAESKRLIVLWIAPSEKNAANDQLEKRLWEAADQLRANSGLNA